MNRRTLLRTLAGSGIATIATGTATAQSQNSSSNSTSTSTSSTEPITQISDDVALLSWEEQEVDADDRTAVAIVLDVDRPASVSLSDPFDAIVEAGVTRVDGDSRVEVLSEGRNRIVEEVTTIEDVGALSVSVDEGTIVISTAAIGGQGSSRSTSLAEGVAIGGATGIAGTGIAAWRHTRDDLDAPEPMDDNDGGLI
jgi:hypothetical protein